MNQGYTRAGAAPGTPASAPGRRWTPLATAGWALAGVALAAALWGWLKPAPAPAVLRYAMALPNGEQLAESRGHRIAISPDGSRMVYVGPGTDGNQLWLRSRSQLHAAPIPGTERATVPFFSPDGSRVGFIVEGNTEMKVVTLNGAPPITIADSALGADGATWSDDGFVYYDGFTGGGTNGLVRVAAGGGRPEQVTTVDTAGGEVDHFWPMALPGKRGVLFTIQKRNTREASDVAVLDLKTLKRHTLVQGITARYSPSGHLLYLTAGGDLVAVPFDLQRLAVTGEPFALTSGVAGRPFGAADLALSRSGTLLYLLGAAQAAPSEVVYVNREGVVSRIDSGLTGNFQTLALSPDGRRLALSRIDGSDHQVWVKELPGGPISKLTFEGTRSSRPVWSPDGRDVGFLSNQGSTPMMYRKRADGSTTDELVIAHPGRPVNEAFWSRDGRWLVYRTFPNDIFARRVGPDTTTIPLLVSSFNEIMPALSPDGRWLAYASDESGQFEVFVRPFPSTQSAKWQISSGGGFEPHWSHSGRELLYWSGNNTLTSVQVLPGATFTAGRRTSLFSGNDYAGDIGSWDITPDDKRFVLIRNGAGSSTTSEIIVVENLTAELRAHTP